jgi:hypothetical protein
MMRKRRYVAKLPTPDLSRRRFLVNTAIAPLLLWLPGRAAAASTIHQLEGPVFVNNRPATEATSIKDGDQIVVAHGGKLAISIGGDAYLLRGGTVLETSGHGNAVISGLRLVTGAMLAVFAKRRKPAYIVTSTATIGIRGTGVYLSTQPHRLYTCTCYGETDLRIGHHVEQISATHHNAHEIAPDSNGLMAMKSMEVIDHTDDELRMLEGYVGRVPPFDL